MASPTSSTDHETNGRLSNGGATGSVDSAHKANLAGRAHQLLSYLEGLHRLRHPVEFDAIPGDIILAPGLPDHEAVRLKPTEGVIVEVDRIDLPNKIPVPPTIAGRVEWTDVQRRPRLRPRADNLVAGVTPGIDPEQRRFDEWIERTWKPWREQIQSTLDARQLFLRLYDLRLAAERDLATHEVVWAHGVAVGRSSDGELVRSPLFVHPVRYDLDNRDGSIRVMSTGVARLEIDQFERLVDTFDMIKRIEVELSADPAESEEGGSDGAGRADDAAQTSTGTPVEAEVIERLSKVIADARYLSHAETIPAREKHWQFADIEGLFHRPRPVRYEAYFRALDEALDNGYLPDTWSAILADEPTTAPISEWVGSSNSPWASLDERIFSPLPLNKQQLNILKRIAGNAGVTVQGPPGTGKSYAIAALTSHFLTHGLRVLICAEKPQPLKVIREKMPEQLQQLCVAVLGDDRAANQQLEASIAAITAKVNAVDPKDDQTRLEEVDAHLDRIRRRLAEQRNRELEIRHAEQRTVTIDDTSYGVATAARHLTANPSDAWITDDLSPETAIPLTSDGLAELINLTHRLGAQDRQRYGPPLCGAEHLVTGAQLAQYWQQLAKATETTDSVATEVNMATVAEAGSERLQETLGQVRRHRNRIAWATGTQWSVIFHAMSVSESQRERWRQLVEQLASEAKSAMELSLQLAAHKIEYPNVVDGKDPAPLLADLRQRFAKGRGLPRVGGGGLKALVAAISIDGHQPAGTADLDLLHSAISRDEHRRRLVTLWNNELCPHGMEPLDPNRPEDLFQTNHQPSLAALINLPGQSAELQRIVGPQVQGAHDHGANDYGTTEHLDVVIRRLEAAAAVFERDRLAEQLDTFGASIAQTAVDGHLTARALHDALLQQDSTAWDAAAEETRRLHQLEPLLRRHSELAGRLAATTPALAQIYRDQTPPHSAHQVMAGWRWRQLRHWIDEILGLGDLASISTQIAETEEEEQRLLTEVVTQRAWLEMAKRTTGAHRSALETWAQAMGRIGKGTGKHAPRHRRTAQRAMRSAQNAVPVWIMSIAQAIDSFRPGEDTAFDIVIIDEASQAPLDALAVLGLGQRVLVVGDDRQISPTVITDESEADRLRLHHLGDVPDADGFDIRTSLYDTAARRFPGVIQLQEHFRSLPEIIAFSNDLSYEGRIDPLREHHPNPEWQPVRAVRVRDGYRDGKVNHPEADAVVGLVSEVINDPAFGPGVDYPNGATIGIVTTIGSDQAKAIQNRLIEVVSIEQMEDRRIRVGSPYEFQGDERDVIIISMVDAITDGGKVTGRPATAKREQQSYNVAASRARDQLIVVHSFDPALLSETDLRRRLVAYAQNPKRRSEATGDLRARCESRFERDVLEKLLKLGPRVDAQHPVAGYRIDFTLTDLSGYRVAIECDGDSFHGIEQLRHDTERQRVLERMGWRFVRIRASEFYADPSGSFQALVERAKGHGLRIEEIDPTGGSAAG